MIQGQLPSYIEHSMFCWKALEVFKEQEKLRQFIVNLKCLDLWSSQNDINTYFLESLSHMYNFLLFFKIILNQYLVRVEYKKNKKIIIN